MGSIQFTYTTGLIPKNIRKHDRNPLCVIRVSAIHQYIVFVESWLIHDIDNCTFRSNFTMTGQLLLGVTLIYEKEHLQNGYVQTRLIFFGLYNHDVLSSEKRYVPLQMFTHDGILSWVLIQNQHGLLNRVPNIIANCLDTWLKGKEIAEAKRERIKTNCIVPDTSCHNLCAFLQFPNVLILVNMARFYVVINGSCCMQQIIQLQNW